MSEDSLPVLPAHRSLIRPDRDHVLGGERSFMVSLGAIVFIFVMLVPSIPTIAIALLLMTVGVSVLREMAKRDPQFSRVVIRRLLHQREYKAHAHVGAFFRLVNPQQRDS